MAIPVSGKTYRFTNVGASPRRLNLYSSGTAANEMNVVLYTADDTNEQQWLYSNNRLLIKTNTSYCLDRFVGSTAPNNADVYSVASQWDADQKITFVEDGSYIKIKLSSASLYLTAVSNANGTSTGKSSTSAGNVYWAASSSSNLQKWSFAEVVQSNGSYTWPTESKTITQAQSSTHLGIDIGPKVNQVRGDKIYAFMAGTVSAVLNPTGNPNEGYSVRIHHVNPLSNGYVNIRTQYMHMNGTPSVSVGQQVIAGQLIGYMGNSGNVIPAPSASAPGAGTHLHFEIRGGTAAQFPIGGSSSYETGTVLQAMNYLNLI